MKKLMFAVAMASSTVAFGATLDDFEAEDGIYTVTFTQKALEYKYSSITDKIIASGETKYEAEQAAREEFENLKEETEEYPNLQAKSIKTKWDSCEEVYVCTLTYTYDSTDDEAKTALKSVSVTETGILVKGVFGGDLVTDGACLMWAKNKANRDEETGKYIAYPWGDDLTINGSADGKFKKSVVTIDDGVSLKAVGFGSTIGNKVKTASGNVVSASDELFESTYGTWKLQKDNAATKLAEKGATLEQILNKKGATEAEIIDAE